MNDIIKLLDLEDSNIIVTNVGIIDRCKILTLETPPDIRFCPLCGYRMHSRGITERTINHPVLQDSYHLILKLRQRRWRCTNDSCRHTENETFNFVNKRSRTTNVTDWMIVDAFRDLSSSASDIARKFNTSDTHVLEVFSRYVSMSRFPLSEAISIDEVHLDMDKDCKYALVIQDFLTGDTIDLVKSRRQDVTEPYFASIPKSERYAVKYLITDMYNEYIRYVDKYFPNAKSVVDSFHVVQWINSSLDKYIRDLLGKFKERDEQLQIVRSMEAGRVVHLPMSDEVYLLKNYRFFLLQSPDNIVYHQDPHIDRHFRYLMNSYDYEREFFSVDPNLKELKHLRDLYLVFNRNNAGKPQKASSELDNLIDIYRNCDQPIFVDFARLLKKYRAPIINSFVLLDRYTNNGDLIVSRLSNGPIESLNRKAKDLQRLGRGYRNFDNLRNRFLFATRQSPALNGRPIQDKDGPVSLRFKNTVDKSRQRVLAAELDDLLEMYPDISKDELKAVRHWVADGNSPFKNPDFIYDAPGGTIADFIAASRILDEAFND